MKKRKSSKSSRRKPKTGAPPADFLLLLTKTPISDTLAKSRRDRQAFRSLSTKEVFQKVKLLLLDLADRVTRPRVILSPEKHWQESKSLAAAAVLAADLLEQLAASSSIAADEIYLAAAQRVQWPVNLQLGRKRSPTGGYVTILVGADEAKDYLERIHLGQFVSTSTHLRHFFDQEANPFKRAAELLLHALIHWREQGAWRPGCDGKVTPWAKKLISLGDGMNAENADAWWSVAKQWMDEQWQANQELFLPLVKACKAKGKPLLDAPLFGSEIKSRIIDVRLREAFYSLAKPADL